MVKLRLLSIGSVLVTLVGCASNWDTTQPDIISAGDLRCDPNKQVTIWEAQGSREARVGCSVVVKYRAPRASACWASLRWDFADGSPSGTDGLIRASDGRKTVTVSNVNHIVMECGGTSEDASEHCHYDIASINCGRAGDVNRVIDMGPPTAPSSDVGCGTPRAPIWSPPGAPARNKDCSVTVEWGGADQCNGAVTAVFPSGEKPPVESVGARKMLVTFVRVGQLSFECRGGATAQKCKYAIVSTQCK